MTRGQLDNPELAAGLDPGAPDRLAVGRGSALLLSGWCFHRELAIRRLHVVVGGVVHESLAHSVTRRDVPRAQEGEAALRSGYWAVVGLAPISARQVVEVELEVTLAGGARVRRSVGSLTLEPELPRFQPPPGFAPRPGEGRGPQVCICMTAFDPPLELFRTQVETIRGQTLPRWTCVIGDDGSAPERLSAIREVIGDDPRFALHPWEQRVGFYRNFERSLGMVAPSAELVALADHDDRWYPGKLERLVEAIGTQPVLAYSDTRVVDGAGRELSPSLWTARPNQYRSLASQLVANTVPGAASLFRRELLGLALPFPPPIGRTVFHDHWLGCVALAVGDLAYVDEPLYDYVQHGANILSREVRALRPADYGIARRPSVAALRKRGARRSADATIAEWRDDYFEHVMRLAVIATVLELRCGDRLAPVKRRELARIARAEGSLRGLAWLSERWARSRQRPSSTMGRELVLLRGALWKRLATARARLP